MTDDEVARRLPVEHSTWAASLHRRRQAHMQRSLAYRVAFAFSGFVVLIVGIITIPLPGPGWATVFLGLGMLAMEFSWAERLALRVLAGLQAFWTMWVAAPSWKRTLIVLLVCAITAAAVMFSASVVGAPDFVPQFW